MEERIILSERLEEQLKAVEWAKEEQKRILKEWRKAKYLHSLRNKRKGEVLETVGLGIGLLAEKQE